MQAQLVQVAVHQPPNFGATQKPHICKVNGQWWALWPTNWPSPVDAQIEPFKSYMRMLNGISPWRPTSILIDEAFPVQ